MKRLLGCIIICVGVMGFQAVHQTDFSGSWKLDLRKSKNLPDAFRNVDRYIMEVQQNADSLVAVVRMEGKGQKTTLPPLVCVFAHKEDYTEDTLRLAKHWISSEWMSTGTKLIIHKKNILQVAQTEQRSTETDVWMLKNRSTLIISVTQKLEKDGSTKSEQRIFHRVK